MIDHSIVPEPRIKQNDEDPDKHKYGFSMVLVIAIGIPVVGVVSGWNYGAASGLWSLFVGTVVVGLLYVCLISCYGELCGAVPFSGGAFGYCRCALGPFWGFVVGASEVLQYFSYGIVSSASASCALSAGFQTPPFVEPVYVLFIYVVTFFLQLRGGNLLWNAVIVCSIITIVPVVLFLCGAFAKYDYNKYADMQPTMYNGFPAGKEFMAQALLGPTCFFIGIEMLPQVCNHVRNPNVTLPRGLFYGCLLSMLLSLLVVVACAGIAPGYGEEFSLVVYPLDSVLREIYGIPVHISDILFVVPANLLCVFSMMYSSSHQMSALAKSALLPTFLGSTNGPHNVPYAALVVSTLLQFTVYCTIHYKYTEFDPYSMLLISAIFVYLGVFVAYIVFSLRFKNIQRHWYSPLGISGAVLGIGLDVVLMVSTMGYTFKDTTYVTVYFVYVALCVLYYLLYAQHHQFYSPEEQQKFLKAYITNVNKRKRSSKSTFSVSMVVGDMMAGGGSWRYSAKSRETSIVGRLERSLTPNRVIPTALESIDRTGVDLLHTEETNERRDQVESELSPSVMVDEETSQQSAVSSVKSIGESSAASPTEGGSNQRSFHCTLSNVSNPHEAFEPQSPSSVEIVLWYNKEASNETTTPVINQAFENYDIV